MFYFFLHCFDGGLRISAVASQDVICDIVWVFTFLWAHVFHLLFQSQVDMF